MQQEERQEGVGGRRVRLAGFAVMRGELLWLSFCCSRLCVCVCIFTSVYSHLHLCSVA